MTSIQLTKTGSDGLFVSSMYFTVKGRYEILEQQSNSFQKH